MICYNQIWTTIAAVASAIFSGCIVCLTFRQKRIQEDNYRLSLFKERFRAVEPVFSAYSYFEGGLNQFIKGFISESKDSLIPERGYGIKMDLHEAAYSFVALFQNKEEDLNQFIKDFDNLLDCARVMCLNIPKKQYGNGQMELHTFLFERASQEPITKEGLFQAFPKAKVFIDDFCHKQSDFIKQYSSFIRFLKEKVVIE